MEVAPGVYRKRRQTTDGSPHAHYLTFSCHRRAPLLSRDRTRRWFLDALEATRVRWPVAIHAFVIMPEHVHAIVRPLEPGVRLATILQSIKQPVARRAGNWLREHDPGQANFLWRRRPDGRFEARLWERGGGYDRSVVTRQALRKTIDYIHANPVRRGLVESPESWQWSSAPFYAGDPHAMFAVDRVRL